MIACKKLQQELNLLKTVQDMNMDMDNDMDTDMNMDTDTGQRDGFLVLHQLCNRLPKPISSLCPRISSTSSAHYCTIYGATLHCCQVPARSLGQSDQQSQAAGGKARAATIFSLLCTVCTQTKKFNF
jgi:hypothetical protein